MWHLTYTLTQQKQGNTPTRKGGWHPFLYSQRTRETVAEKPGTAEELAEAREESEEDRKTTNEEKSH